MNVISIQSQVAFGHVGNSAAVFPMQMHGIDVVAVPTTLLSNRPGYPTIRGRVLDAQLVADLLLGIEERGAVDTAQMILSGYLGSADNAAVVADFVARAKAKNPDAAVLLRPRARGSRPRPVRPRRHPAAGARPAVPACRYHHAQSFRVRMAERGEGRDDRSGDQGGARVHGARPTVVVTSAELADTPEGEIESARRRARQRLARAHAKTADQPERHRRSVRRAAGCRARPRGRHAGCAQPRRLRHLRRAGTHRGQRAPRKCASSRARSSSFIRSASSNVSRSARRAD